MKMDIVRGLVRWLRNQRASRADMERYLERSKELPENDAPLCPICFFNPAERNKERPLSAMDAKGRYEPLKCANCECVFELPAPP